MYYVSCIMYYVLYTIYYISYIIYYILYIIYYILYIVYCIPAKPWQFLHFFYPPREIFYQLQGAFAPGLTVPVIHFAAFQSFEVFRPVIILQHFWYERSAVPKTDNCLACNSLLFVH